MYKHTCLLFLLLFSVYAVSSQDYYSECISSLPDLGYVDTKTNTSGEIILNNYSTVIKLDKFGKEIWKKTYGDESVTKIELDNSGNVYVLTSQSVFIPNPPHYQSVYRLYKYLNNANGSPAFSPIAIFEPQFVESFVLDKAGNIYMLLGNNDVPGSLLYDYSVLKYNASGVFQWPSKITDECPYFMGSALTVNEAGETFVISSQQDLPTLTYSSVVVKLNVSGDSLWKRSFDVPYIARQQSIRLDNGGNVLVSMTVQDDQLASESEFFLLNPQTGKIMESEPISLGELYFATAGNNTFVLGRRVNVEDWRILKLSSNLTPSVIVDAMDFWVAPNAFLVDPAGEYAYVTREEWMSLGSVRLVLDQYDMTGKLASQFMTYSINAFSNPVYAPPVFDLDYNFLVPKPECLLKVEHCTNLPFTLTEQPINTEVCANENATFRVGIQGKGLRYYWYKNNELLSNSSKFEGANSATLIIKQASIYDPGSYYCEIKDGCGRILKTQSRSLTVISAPVLTAQPKSISRCVGAEAIFSVTTGGRNVKYQWKKGNVALAESATVVGTKTNTLTLKTISATDGGEYYCEVIGDCTLSTIASQKATLGIELPTTIVKQPGSLTSCTGSAVVFSVNATGTNIVYQWKKGGSDLVESSRFVGTKTNTLTLSQLQSADAGEYSCVVTGTCGTGSVASSKGLLTVTTDQQITSHPTSKSICTGANTTFSVAASATSGVTYQWLKGNTNLTNNTRISGVTTSTLTIQSTTTSDEGEYICMVTTSCGNKLVSQAANLSIGTTAFILSKSADLNLCFGELAKLSITSSGGVTSFQWKKDGIPLTDGPTITGAKTSELFVNDVLISDAGNYTCEVTSACGLPKVSGPIKLAVKEGAIITEEANSQTVCEQESVVLKISASGTSPSYQWRNKEGYLVNNTRLSGVTTPVLTIKDLTLFEEGYYTCEVSGCAGVVASNPTLVKVNPRPQLILKDDINCDNPVPEWSSLVIDEKHTFGVYSLFKDGSTEPLPDLRSISETGIYFIVKQTEECSDTVQWNNLCLITGGEANIIHDVFVYPNPTDRWIQIRYDPAELQEFALYDARGVQIDAGILESTGETVLDGNALAGGVYAVRLKNNKGHFIFQRFIVKR